MEHILKFEGPGLQALHDFVFPAIAKGQTILFLGAGASVTDKRMFLSRQIMELYADRKGIELQTNDIVDFVDTLSADPNFSRRDFDDFVDSLLRVLKVDEVHRIIASLNWKEIITTNFDLLIEKAFDEVLGTPEENLKIYPVQKASEYQYTASPDEVKYVKLNGSLIDKKAYPLVFSTKDFEKAGTFYKTVLRSLENLSPKINFLSVGYSFSDEFSKSLLKRFDKYEYRNRRWMMSIDPFVEDARLPYFTENRICIIRCSTRDFFAAYKTWADEHAANLAGRKRVTYVNRENNRLQLPGHIALRVSNDLIQLSDAFPTPVVSPQRFYKGEEPTYDVIKKNLDVVKKELLETVTQKIEQILSAKSTLVPILFLTGSYGTGKTTFSYRVISFLIHDDDFDALGFEVIDAANLKSADLDIIFRGAKSKNIVLFFNGIELDSAFKALIEFRTRLSTEHFQDFNVLILASIRENILAKYESRHSHLNTVELKVDAPFSEDEATDLVQKLRDAKLVNYRDARERNSIAKKIVDEYSGDPLIALISLVSGSSHDQILRNAYLELTPLAQRAFLYTSLLYRFNIRMPAALLRALLSKTWEEFTRDVLKYDSKGILIQDEIESVGTNPDIYIRTKHPIISDVLVNLMLSNADKRFESYRALIQHLNPSVHSSTLIVDLLKAIRDNNDLSNEKIDWLFDAGSQIFQEDPHFNLHYAINLQYRGTEEALLKGIERIQDAETFLEKRNHLLIHRRAVLNFRLAQLKAKEEIDLNETFRYIQEARVLFDIKLILDPFTWYSYVEYIRFELWYLDTVKLNELDRISQKIRIEELLDRAEKSVVENAHIITDLRAEYFRKSGIQTMQQKLEYLDFLEQEAQDATKRPYVLILKFYYYEALRDSDEIRRTIIELEPYSHLDEVAKVLFRYYGRHLYNMETRLKFFEIVTKHVELEKREPLPYHYYSFIAEAYNGSFQYAYEHVQALRGKFAYLHPGIEQVWRDENTLEPKRFEGIVRFQKGRKRMRIVDLQQTIDLVPGNYSDLGENSQYHVVLHFYLNGVRAEIDSKIKD